MNLVKIVIGVDVIEASSLDGMNIVRKGVVSLPSNLSWVPVRIQVPAKLTIINKVDDKNTPVPYLRGLLWAQTCVLQSASVRWPETAYRFFF